MAIDKPEEITRRDFIGLALGSALVAGIGCGNDSGPGQTGVGGTSSATGGSQGSNPSDTDTGEGGSTNTSKSGKGGTTASSTGKSGTASGGSSPKSASNPEGGSTQTGGASNSGSKASNGGSSTGGKTSSATGGKSSQAGSSSSTSSTTSGDTAYVALVRDTDWAKATEDAINLAGGLPDLTGKTVVIRPNVIEGQPDGTTNPEVIRGVIRAAKKKGASEILVAEDAFNGAVLDFMKTLGITKVCDEEGATPTELKNSKTTKVKPANATAWAEGIEFYDIVKNADYVINVPKCKTHATNASFSLSLKAWFGCVKRPSSSTLHSDLPQRCAETHLVRQEDFVVLDATRCMTTGGPMKGTMAESKIVVASKDPIAVDVTGVAIIRHNGGLPNTVPWDHAQIKRAMSLQYPGWLSAKTDFTYKAVGIDEAEQIMAKRS